MRNLLPDVLLFPALLSLAACAASVPAATSTAPAPDTTRRAAGPVAPEDLSRYRPLFSAPPVAVPVPAGARGVVAPTNQVNAQIEQRLRDQAFTNQNVKYAQGFRIRAYVGLERDQVMAIRRAVISRYPEETDYLTFKQPVYRLFLGDYLTRLEAEQALLRLRPFAPKAELEPTQVLLNKTAF